MSKDGDDHCIKNQSADDDNHTKMNRRSMLLGGTTLAAISTVAPGSPVHMAQAQQPAAPSGKKPNILVIFGDDIGQSNISA